MSTSRTVAVAVATSLVTSMLVGVGALAWANHDPRASDVPTGNVFHDDIADFLDAGCATGFPDGTFRPRNPVLRQQMARFIAACAGRVTFNEQRLNGMNTTFQNAAPIILEAGALGSGGGFVLLIGTVEAQLTAGTPPCEISASLEQAGGTSGGDDTIRVNLFETGETDEATGTLLDLVPVQGGSTVTAHIRTRVDNSPNCSTATINTDYSLAAVYMPFAGDGTGGGA